MTEAKNDQVIGEKYRFTILTDRMIRMEYNEQGDFLDAPTQVVVNRNFGEADFKVNETDSDLEIITEAVHLYYKKGEKFTEQTLFADVKYSFSVFSNRWYYGHVGENLFGTLRTLDGVDGEAKLDNGILGKSGYATLDDSNSFLLSADGEPLQRSSQGTDIYLFAYGRSYLDALKDFFKLTGETPLLPRYALGNWWSRYWKYDEESYLALMDKFHTKKVPLSVSVIDMDWHLTEVPSRFGSGWTGYTWNKTLFPNPERFLKALHDRGLAVTLNVHPADGIRAFEESYPRVAERLGLDVTAEEPAIFDFTDKKFREVYFEEVHRPLEKEGTDFWWIDWQQGTTSSKAGLDPLWQLNHFHFEDIRKNDPLGIILSRYAGPGSHRYPIGFSGDAIISWKSLDFQPYMTATASNVGYAWWSHDIGGHMLGYKDEELSLRWLQFGVFSPINRLHSSSSAFTSKEPWEYNLVVETIMEDFLRLRHAFLPYLYTKNVVLHEEGIPLIKPMYYDYPEDEAAYHVPNEYLFGDQLLVLPITKPSNKTLELSKANLWLPEGDWYDFFSSDHYVGGTQLAIYRPIEKMPVFAKSGAIIPLDADPVATKATELPETIEWRIYPGESNQFKLVEDKDGQRVETSLSIDEERGQLELITEGATEILPAKRNHVLKFMSSTAVKVTNSDDNDSKIAEITYDSEHKVTEVTLVPSAFSFNADLVDFQAVKVTDGLGTYQEILKRANIENQLKDYLWDIISHTDDRDKLSNVFNRLDDRELASALFEVLYTQK